MLVVDAAERVRRGLAVLNCIKLAGPGPQAAQVIFSEPVKSIGGHVRLVVDPIELARREPIETAVSGDPTKRHCDLHTVRE